MKAFPWIAISVVAAVAAYIIINQPGPAYATGDPDVEGAAYETALWGSKQRIKGTGRRAAGRVKEGLGQAVGDEELAGEGVEDQVVGAVKDTAGKVAQAAGQVMHDLNQ
jgi:uncharacterized protein YjbJ (UPF0337 family)